MMEKMVFTPYEQVKTELVKKLSFPSNIYSSLIFCVMQASEKNPPPSFVSDLLSWPENAYEDRRMFEDAVIWTAGSMYGGM